MSKMIKIDEEYKKWVEEISKRFRKSQIKAAMKVNDEMLRFYWSLGCDMDRIKENYDWGAINRRGICASEWGAIA